MQSWLLAGARLCTQVQVKLNPALGTILHNPHREFLKKDNGARISSIHKSMGKLHPLTVLKVAELFLSTV